MSGYCLDCGNEMCVCNICECEECKPIPAMTFVSFEAYEKLQEQNKILKEALDFYSDDGGRDGEDISNVQKCIMGMIVVVAKGGKRARETLEKVGE